MFLMGDTGEYSVQKISSSRTVAIDMMHETVRRHHVKALVEVDVTDARASLRRSQTENGPNMSFTAWLMKCISTAAEEFPEACALRRGKKLYLFKDIDISTMIELRHEGVVMPLPYVVRRTNEKSVEQISAEIDVFKRSREAEGEMVLGDEKSSRWVELYLHLPTSVRRAVWRQLVRMPRTLKRFGGTIIVTSVGMFGKGGGWAITFGLQSLAFAIGGIAHKPSVTPGGIVPRELLSMTILIDHDVIDGAPAARFVARLIELIENSHGLESYAEPGG